MSATPEPDLVRLFHAPAQAETPLSLDANPDNYSREELEAALLACIRLASAYAHADGENSGSSELDWEDIDLAYDAAHDALGEKRLSALDAHARECNNHPGDGDGGDGDVPAQ